MLRGYGKDGGQLTAVERKETIRNDVGMQSCVEGCAKLTIADKAIQMPGSRYNRILCLLYSRQHTMDMTLRKQHIRLGRTADIFLMATLEPL